MSFQYCCIATPRTRGDLGLSGFGRHLPGNGVPLMGRCACADYPGCMATKNRSNGRSGSRPSPAIRELFAFHFQASRRRDEILEEAKGLQVAGRIPEARQLLKRARKLQKHLKALAATAGYRVLTGRNNTPRSGG